MKLFFSYLFLQCKRCLKAFSKSLLIMILTISLVGLIAWGMIGIFSAKSLTLAKIGVVIPEEESLTQYVTGFIESMDSIRSVCEFEYMDEESAVKGFENGELQAVVVIPEGFFHDVQVGYNPPATLYFPEDPGIIGSTFKEVVISGVSFLQTAEAGVYSAIDTAYAYEADMSIADIGNTLAIKYVAEVLGRDKHFVNTVVSPLGEMTILQYYLLSGTVIVLMFSGISYSFMYNKTSKTVTDKLKVNGVNVFWDSIAKILAMLPFTYLISLLLYAAMILISKKYELNIISFDVKVLAYLAILSLTMVIYFQLVYGLTGSGKTGIFVLIIINIIGASVSGLIVPQAYLSDWTKIVGNILPMKYWVKYLAYVFFGISGGAL